MIRKWHLNGLKAGIAARLPGRNLIRRVKRRIRPYAPAPENDAYYLENALLMVRTYREKHRPACGAYLEFGVGWTPLLAVAFAVAGCGRATLCDLDPFLDDAGVARARALIGARLADLAAAAGISEQTAAERLSRFEYDYLSPYDFAAMPAGSFDVIASRAVLEHVPATDVPGLFNDLRRLLAPGGAAIHLIDNSDHFEHGDNSISRVNFLRYADKDWRRIQMATKTSQNRLRHSDYARLFQGAGFTIAHETRDVHERSIADLALLRVADRYRDYAPDDLATLTSLFVLT